MESRSPTRRPTVDLYASGWAAVTVGSGVAYLRRSGSAWQIVGATRDTLSIFYSDFQNGRPTTVNLRAAASGATADIAFHLSQIDVNPTLDPQTFQQENPADAMPLTLDELRRAGPWVRRAREKPGDVVMKRPTPLTVRAHAKVNLDLRVLGVRPDGYHELRTVFQTIELHDTLVCAERPGPFTLKCRTSGIPLDSENLIWKAAAVLWTALGRAGDVRDTSVTIDKRIPVQAGLGGGSADAAAALAPSLGCGEARR